MLFVCMHDSFIDCLLFHFCISYSLFASAPRPHVSPILGLLSDTFLWGGDPLHARLWSRSQTVSHLSKSQRPLVSALRCSRSHGSTHDEVSTQDLIPVQMIGEQMRGNIGIKFKNSQVFNHFICAKKKKKCRCSYYLKNLLFICQLLI